MDRVSAVSKLVYIGNVILRVPSIFLLELWYRTDPEEVIKHNFGNDVPHEMKALAFIMYYTVLAAAISIQLLPRKKLISLYLYMLGAVLLTVMHFAAFRYVEEELSAKNHSKLAVYEDKVCMHRIGLHLVIQVVLAAVIAYLLPIKDWTRFLLLVYTLPMISRAVNVPIEFLPVVHNFSSIFTMLMCLMLIFNNIGMTIDLVKAFVIEATILRQMGWLDFVLAMWSRLCLAPQLLTFWLTLLSMRGYFSYIDGNNLAGKGIVFYILMCISESCATPISLMGLCTTVSYTASSILLLTRIYLKGWEGVNLNPEITGWTEGFTMLLLTVQTDALGMKPSKRVFLMSIELFIVSLSLVQSMYEITDPVLLALSASHNKSLFKHIKAVVLSTVLWIFPLFISYTLCQIFDIDYWMLVIISSCILTSLQVLGSLAVYTLFIYDSLLSQHWENLDDIVYWVRAIIRVLEFLVAVFVVLYGVKESLFGSWCWINFSILVFHFYFNVWERLQSGWKSFLLRREAVRKVESLPHATVDQLQQLNDVCAICYQEMETAVITPCCHYFHSICLRKWLYVKENCPICHGVITFQELISPSVDLSPVDEHHENEDEWEDIDDAIEIYANDSDYSSSRNSPSNDIFNYDCDENELNESAAVNDTFDESSAGDLSKSFVSQSTTNQNLD